ncbi:hypothetical protein [Kitasatospora cheerisanensis]|uniref:Uncharacterized protein n=1 Tax=Kitasatospora cheerisanensis KCTC 2395 TaxID=1348663 RepID=A0A066YY76_9ACTN|nr:hypothetical protein [Kitasatospora cheerisanensis]KDN86498.1 hypothetical protein KCH_17260 [Kitasatospora cheerisanensis KCTC 2395]
MGLDVVVGALIGAEEDTADWFRGECATIRAVLEREGLPAWQEPLEGQQFGDRVWGYSGLHTLRRLAAHLAADGRLPEPLAEGERASQDPVLQRMYEDIPDDPAGPFDHLIHHSDCEGYYVPVEFGPVLVDEELSGGALGSSVRLLAELRALAEALGLPEGLDPDGPEVEGALEGEDTGPEPWRRYGTESFICLQLMRAARHSVETGAVMAFC